jgi:hypothetical protein
MKYSAGPAFILSYKENFTNHIDFNSFFIKVKEKIKNIYNINIDELLGVSIYGNEIESVYLEYEIEKSLFLLNNEITNFIKNEIINSKNVELLNFIDVTEKLLHEDVDIINEFNIDQKSLYEYKNNYFTTDNILDKIIDHGKDSLTEIDLKILNNKKGEN